jgi:hypothetical protein
MTDVLVAALAAFWGWQVLNMRGPLTPLRRLLVMLPAGPKLIVCPYCIGAWFALAATLVLQAGRLDWQITTMTWLAAAGLVGLVGSFIPVYGEETD